MEARNTFHEGVGAETLKCVTGHNHCGCRNEKFNKGLVETGADGVTKLKLGNT